ncbi:MAG: CvpA family protein [Legionella sp.]|nr:CvpA family protein [Legionella sp.]
MQLLWVDITIISLITLSVVTGLFRGFVKELVALCVWILALWLAYHYSAKLDPELTSYFHDKTMRSAVSFLLIFFATLLAGGVFNAILSFIMKRTGLSGTDRALGFGFGLLRGIFIVALLMVAIKWTALPYQQYTESSKLYAQFDPLVAWLYGKVPQFISQVKNLDVSEADIEQVPLILKKSL